MSDASLMNLSDAILEIVVGLFCLLVIVKEVFCHDDTEEDE